MKVAVIGVTGMVGQVLLELLEKRDFPLTELIAVASERSTGKKINFKDKTQTIVSIEDAVAQKPDFALFSAGGGVSKEWAPKFAEAGTTVIDNSSAWRLDPTKKLIVPEVNGATLTDEDKIIANPNCSTTQLVMALYPLHKKYKIKRAIVSTYQSVTGSGKAAVDQLVSEEKGTKAKMVYPYAINRNAIPHCDVFEENGYTKEEMKLTNETVKILGDQTVSVAATAVRIPVVGGHSESVNLEFEQDFSLAEIRKALNDFPGITVQDNPDMNVYPMPAMAEEKDDVFVGRIRKDFTAKNALNLWIVADNLRKGAATNAIQIAEFLVKRQKEKSYTKLDLKR